MLSISKDFRAVQIKIPISWKNKNYVGTIFGGSLFSATDPIYMIQLTQILGRKYVVWDKASVVRFKRPAKEDAYATFSFSDVELERLRKDVEEQQEVDLQKQVVLTSKAGTVFCEIDKTLYVADKAFYKEKMKRRKATAKP